MENFERLEYEISQLQSNELNFPVQYMKNKKDYIIDIGFPQSMIDPPLFQEDIIFSIYIDGEKYPLAPPRLYCITQFSFPTIADGRDILDLVLDSPWEETSKLVDILPLLQSFIKNYISQSNLFVGHYYLGEKYDMRILKKLNIELKTVKENIVINGKWTKLQRFLLISDVYFLLFEQDKKNKNKITLIFWAPINSILMIKKILINKAVFIYFRQNYTLDPYEMCLTIEKGEETVDLLLQRMQYFGFNFNVSKQKNMKSKINIVNKNEENDNNNNHQEVLESGDDINIEKLLEDIKNVEEQIKSNGEKKELNELLFNLYINAEKYYREKVDTTNAEIYKNKRESIKV